MVDIGDLVYMDKSLHKVVGIVVDKKLVPETPYAAPMDNDWASGFKRDYPETLIVKVILTCGEPRWINPRLLSLINQGNGGT